MTMLTRSTGRGSPCPKSWPSANSPTARLPPRWPHESVPLLTGNCTQQVAKSSPRNALCTLLGMRRTRTPHELGFDQHDRQPLACALRRATEVRIYRRVQAVLLVARGHCVPEVAQLTGTKAAAVYDWVARYLQSHQPNCLADARRSGRPRVATAITDARIKAQFRRDPLRLGYSTTGRTVALLAKHLGRVYDCPITARTLRRQMRALGLRWKRPRYLYANTDPHRTQKKGAYSPPEADAQKRGLAVPRRDHPPVVPAVALRLGVPRTAGQGPDQRWQHQASALRRH